MNARHLTVRSPAPVGVVALAAVALGSSLVTPLAASAAPVRGGSPASAVASLPTDVLTMGVDELSGLLQSRKITSVELVRTYLDRIAAYEEPYGDQPGVNAVITVNSQALAQAAALDAEREAGRSRGPLHGIPVLVKDNYDTGDLPTTNASQALAGTRPADDATQVERLRAAGAIVLAKTNLHEYAYGITTVSSLGGQTRNPYDQGRNPGGSSGGTGAGVAAAFAAAGMGSDTCGSIRIPAAQNNLVGLRPTLGLSSRDGIMPMSATLDVGGPIAKSVTDLALLLDATVGYDPKDPSTAAGIGKTPRTYVQSLKKNALKGGTIGLITNPGYLGTTAAEAPTTALVRAAVDDMRALGAKVVEIELPASLLAAVASSNVLADEFRRDLNAYFAAPGTVYPEGLAEQAEPTDQVTLADVIADGGVTPSVLPLIRNANAMPDLPNPAYEAKLAARESLQQQLTALFAQRGIDALAYPTIRQVATPVGSPQPGSNCALSALSGFPALSVPAGFTPAGLPVGIELLGLPFVEPKLLGLGYAYEQAVDHRMPPATTPALQ